MSRSFVVTGTFFMLVAGPAFAQEVPPTSPPLTTAPAPAPASDAATEKAARDQFKKANDAYDAERYDEALAAFRSSYGTLASPNTRLMIGRTLVKLNQFPAAYEELERTAREASEKGGKYDKAREAAMREIEQLRPRIGLLTVRVVDAPPGTLVTIGDRDYPAETIQAPLPVMPGGVTVQAMGGGRTSTASASLVPGGEGAVDLVMTAAPEPGASPAAPSAPPASRSPSADVAPSEEGSSLRPWAYVAGGIGVAGFVTFGIFGAMNQSKFSDLEDNCPGGTCPAELEDDIDSGRTYQTVANIGLAVGIVGVAAGATLFVLSMGGEQRASLPRVEVAGGIGSLRVRGAF
jgi:hypothetical protein